MLIAVTGGTGFVGVRLARRMVEAGHRVRILDQNAPQPGSLPAEVTASVGDLSGKPKVLESFLDGADILFHCAAQAVDPLLMEAVNVRGTAALLKVAGGRIGHWVQVSSVAVYPHGGCGGLDEDGPLEPPGIYGETKKKGEELVREAALLGNFTFTVVRPCKVYGPERVDRALLQLIALLDKGRFFFVGKPGPYASYIHVDSLVEGLHLCGTLSGAKGRTYNLADQRTVEEFVGILCGAMGKAPPRFRLPEGAVRLAARVGDRIPGCPLTTARLDGLLNRAFYPTARIERELGFAHAVSMEEGLRGVVDAWRGGS
jgi:nucleoside-diphosphate-sugar epimerase